MSESYAADWLVLRRVADARARDGALLDALRASLAVGPAPLVVDVGCGAGALYDVLTPYLPPSARWRLVDRDAALLDIACAAQPAAERVCADLADPKAVAASVAEADLVAATAFYDLASEAWIDAFVAALPAKAAFYAALTYDGRESWDPPTPDDAAVLAAFHRHQARDFGLGPAAGPGASRRLINALAASGRDVRLASSDWRLRAPDDAALMAKLATGLAEAIAPTVGAATAARWRKAPRNEVRIGHWDIFAGGL